MKPPSFKYIWRFKILAKIEGIARYAGKTGHICKPHSFTEAESEAAYQVIYQGYQVIHKFSIQVSYLARKTVYCRERDLAANALNCYSYFVLRLKVRKSKKAIQLSFENSWISSPLFSHFWFKNPSELYFYTSQEFQGFFKGTVKWIIKLLQYVHI